MSSPRIADIHLAKRMQSMQRSTIREILKITARPDIISFAGGLPAPELFPLETFKAAVIETFEADRSSALQYDVTEGYRPLLGWLSAWHNRQGVQCTPENMMITNGSQQALDLIGKIFLDPGDRIVVENPTYLGAIQAFNAYQAGYRAVPMDAEGIRPDLLAAALVGPSKFVYLVPTFQNPSGVTMTRKRRLEVLHTLAERVVVEDDPYGLLRFSGQAVPSLRALSNDNVIYLSTFSKILSPGIRLGYVIAPKEIIESLVLAKQAADLQPNSLLQRAVYRYCAAGHLEKHIPVITEAYRRRAECMLAAMRDHFPKHITWVTPEGGMFIWCRLPPGLSATRLFSKAIENHVAYVTGEVFHPAGDGEETFRLNFTNSTEEQIKTGIARLGLVFAEAGA